ncbi:protein-L-isoaspartate O-methyltransferase [Nocardioides sp. LS1]|uniref:protein-L-isoaspartate O-methyltransferase family protein n=1 Tax=Nocardioides sp. LS1 TaxID=1027620 RepID=UPI000F621E14|nr:class I SAM-dependent methyltransferase [Nocardioides sp. LS1]GCD91725.1 fibrillarin-like rRNA methylase [Nocardioides sp. LS1]
MDAVSAAFEAVPRAGFLPPASPWRADLDAPIPIGHGQTNSQPRTVEAMLRLLDVRPGQRVLDVGSGSGWTTALLGHLVGPTGTVIGVELEPALVLWGRANLRRTRFTWADIHRAEPGTLGRPAEAPYERVLVSAEAREVPQALLDQLGEEGRMVLPVAGLMTLVVRVGEDVVTSRHGHYRFVPLR